MLTVLHTWVPLFLLCIYKKTARVAKNQITRSDSFLLLKHIRKTNNLDNLQVRIKKHMSIILLFSDTEMMKMLQFSKFQRSLKDDWNLNHVSNKSAIVVSLPAEFLFVTLSICHIFFSRFVINLSIAAKTHKF